MANTTNFGWETPDDTDLVKDGAAAMRTLGNAIDASLVDLKGGTTNQILAKNSNTDMDFKWVTNDVGDITAVTAGTGLSGGGTSGDVTLTNTVATTFDAKGDLVVGTGADTFAKLVAGSNGDSLVTDSSASVGLRYQEPKAGNPVINSAFQVWQRGTSFTSATAYNADRWYHDSNTGRTVSRQTTSDTTNLPNIQFALRYQRNSGNTLTTALNLSQSFETVNSIPFVGKTVTLSFYARRGTNFSGSSNNLSFLLVSGTGTDQNQRAGYTGQALPINTTASLTTTWQRFQATGTVATTATELAIVFEYTPSGTAGADDWFEITGVQLEVGSVATPFKTQGVTLAGEVALCQRYYSKSYNLGTAPGTATAAGIVSVYVEGTINNVSVPVQFKTQMRVAPTITTYSGTGVTGQFSNDLAATTSFNNTVVGNIGEYGCVIYNSTTATKIMAVHYIASAEL